MTTTKDNQSDDLYTFTIEQVMAKFNLLKSVKDRPYHIGSKFYRFHFRSGLVNLFSSDNEFEVLMVDQICETVDGRTLSSSIHYQPIDDIQLLYSLLDTKDVQSQLSPNRKWKVVFDNY